MKKIHTLLFALILACTVANAQTTAMDFTKKDCNGKMHHLFSELDSGNVIIMEFFHTCASCIDAPNGLKPMYQKLVAKYGNKVRFYGTASEDDASRDCSYAIKWITNNGFASMIVPFDSGAVQTAYYGGQGMPTLAIAAGRKHKLLYLVNGSNGSFTPSDTGIISIAIRHFLDSAFLAVPTLASNVSVNIFPNPLTNNLSITIETKEAGALKLELTSITGQKIATLTEEKIQLGTWAKNFPLSLSSGVYFIKGILNEKSFQEKITVLR
jgi:hypothetical protein